MQKNKKQEILEDEVFYKNICKKYIDTMTFERLLEGNKIIHFWVDEEYVSFKVDSNITFDEIKHIRDNNYGIYEYSTYKELFDSVIKNEIYSDLHDLALFDEDGKWDFYITFEELKKIGYGYMVKEHYPLIEKYGVSNEHINDFFNHFSLEQLNDFEHTLHLYFKEKSIIYQQDSYSEFITTESYNFNRNILRLACGLITYQDFIEDYTIKEVDSKVIIEQKVISYFKENKIETLKEYGADRDEGLYKLSSLYSEIMDNLNIKYNNIFTEDGISDGKYITTISFDDETNIIIDTKSSNDFETVIDNLISVSEEYDKWLEKEQKNLKKDNDINYDYE